VVAVVPLGEVNPETVEVVRTAVAARIDAQIRVDAPRELPTSAYYPARKRWRAEKILEAIDSSLPVGAWKVIALTDAEISTTKGDVEDWGIGGLGNIGGKSCVVSTQILRKHSKSKADLHRRLKDLAVHEFGHTLGLDHCPVKGCVMNDAKGKLIKSLDSSTGRFCDYCGLRIEKGVLKNEP
jgi:archaemetzincin